jgi:two-component system, cell cycle sensor histidine kinase and response regulator CckA
MHMSASSAKLAKAANQGQTSLSSLHLEQEAELIGEVARAMANHVNNTMMAVTGYAELELKKPGAKDRRALEQVLANATRATVLIQTLLEFSRERNPSPQAMELNAVVSDIGELTKDILGEKFELSLRLKANPSIIFADRVDVQKSLLTLLIVARDEMQTSGQLTVATSLVELNDEFIGNEDRSKPGEYVVLTVETTPTKEGKSSAAAKSSSVSPSLDTVRARVREASGFVRRSDADDKSTFKIYFPALGNEALSEPAATLPRNSAVARTILVVEDDDAVRIPAAEFLKMEGFKVLQARTGSEALSLAQQSRSSLDLLIADVFMPKMNGHEVAAKLLEQHPDLKIVYMSGDPGMHAGKVDPNTILRKPFRLNVLRDKIHDLLGE